LTCKIILTEAEVHVKWFLKELLVSLIIPFLSSKSVDEKINPSSFLHWLPSGDRAEHFFGNIISTRLKYTIYSTQNMYCTIIIFTYSQGSSYYMFLRLALIHFIFFGNGCISNITPDFYENK